MAGTQHEERLLHILLDAYRCRRMSRGGGRAIYRGPVGGQIIISEHPVDLRTAKNNLQLAISELNVPPSVVKHLKNTGELPRNFKPFADSQKDFGLVDGKVYSAHVPGVTTGNPRNNPRPRNYLLGEKLIERMLEAPPEATGSPINAQQLGDGANPLPQPEKPVNVVMQHSDPRTHGDVWQPNGFELDIINHVRKMYGDAKAKDITEGLRNGTVDKTQYRFLYREPEPVAEPEPEPEPIAALEPVADEPLVLKNARATFDKVRQERDNKIADLKRKKAEFESAADAKDAEAEKLMQEAMAARATAKHQDELALEIEQQYATQFDAAQGLVTHLESMYKSMGAEKVEEFFRFLNYQAHQSKPPVKPVITDDVASRYRIAGNVPYTPGTGRQPRYDYIKLFMDVTEDTRDGAVFNSQEIVDMIRDKFKIDDIQPKTMHANLMKELGEDNPRIEYTSLGFRKAKQQKVQ